MNAPYYCGYCEEPVRLTAELEGELPETEKKILRVECNCTSEPPTSLSITGPQPVIPDTWQLNFDEIRGEGQ